MKDIIDYLNDKVHKVNINNSRANQAAVLLRLYPEYDMKIEELCYIVREIMQNQFAKNSTDNPAGTAKLTALSMSIGKTLCNRISDKPVSWTKHLRVGDLFLEAFFQCDYVSIYREPGFSEFSSRAPYIVAVLEKWEKISHIPDHIVGKILKGTSQEPIKPIRGLFQENHRPLIKRWSVADKDVFKEFLDSPFTKAANTLQSTAWKINHGVLEALKNQSNQFLVETPVIPDEGDPDKVKKAYRNLKRDDTDENREEYQREAELWNIKRAALKAVSKNSEFNSILRKAKLLVDLDEFYQYIEFDYRGRCYSAEGHLNYQGSDIARGLLLFAEERVVTDKGLRWMAIYTANCFNRSYTIEELRELDWLTEDYISLLEEQGLEDITVDKMTLTDREMWTWKNLTEIVEIGRERVFYDCEKPVLFLACAMEWHKYIVSQVEDRPFYSGLPIPVDGSNNGWQHLAAMSRDHQAGALVGLTDTEVPNDFYVETAKAMMKLEQDFFKKAKMPMKHIRNGLSKRGSMTRAYSAGQAKIADSMYQDCYAAGYDEMYGIDMLTCDQLSKSLVDAIDEVCPGPMSVMKYLQEVIQHELGNYAQFDVKTNKKVNSDIVRNLLKEQKTLRAKPATKMTEAELDQLNAVAISLKRYERRLVSGCGSTVATWITPSGFPVFYDAPYMREDGCRGYIKGVNKINKINHTVKLTTDTPDIKSYASGIAPNFVHSMDAAHMMMVILEQGGPFGAIHDSFSVHADDVDRLVTNIKDTFIDIYDVEDFLAEATEWILRDPEGFNEPQPMYGALDVKEIRQAPYFFC